MHVQDHDMAARVAERLLKRKVSSTTLVQLMTAFAGVNDAVLFYKARTRSRYTQPPFHLSYWLMRSVSAQGTSTRSLSTPR